MGDQCRDQCLDPAPGECQVQCFPGRSCSESHALVRGPSIRSASTVLSDDMPLDVEPAFDRAARRDDLSLQLLHVSANGAGQATLRVNHHGSLPVFGARVTLSRANGDVLAARSAVLAPRSSIELTLPCGPCDSLVARLDAGAAFGELDTLNNVARGGAVAFSTEQPSREGGVPPNAGTAPSIRANGALRFVAWIPSEAPVRVSVHDVAGRRIRTLWDGVLPRGERTFEWDGRTNVGAQAERGVYFVRLVAPEAQAVTRVVILR